LNRANKHCRNSSQGHELPLKFQVHLPLRIQVVFGGYNSCIKQFGFYLTETAPLLQYKHKLIRAVPEDYYKNTRIKYAVCVK
jgi:hypothetical protein